MRTSFWLKEMCLEPTEQWPAHTGRLPTQQKGQNVSMMATESNLAETFFSDYQKGFVVFEGTDQSGKTTQVDMVHQAFPDTYLGHQPSSPLEAMGFNSKDLGDWKDLKD